jgi:amino acid transporter
MKKYFWIFLGMFLVMALSSLPVLAQCSICTKTASQLGEGPGKALNSAILYLAFTPLVIMGYIGWRWWKNEKAQYNS